MFNIAVACLVLTTIFSYINHRFIRLPTTIGVMGISLGVSLLLIALDIAGFSALKNYEYKLLTSIDFSEVLMQGMLSMLLFAGALHVDLNELKSYKWQVGTLALIGTVISTVVVGYAMWIALPFIGAPLSLPYCLLFGALISPTDPIAVIGILKSAAAPKSLEIVIAGESLFNDGVAVVMFVLILATVTTGYVPTPMEVGIKLLHEAGGGILFGLVLGYVTYRMLKSIDSYQEEVLITLAAVLGGYALATALHVSGPLTMVVVGLIIGNHGRNFAMSEKTREHIDMFWDLLDSMLNAALFVLLGMEVVLIHFTTDLAVAGTIAIAVTILARLVSLIIPMGVFRGLFALPSGSLKVCVWGGLRGGISVALALSLPAGASKDFVLALTYSVVIFSVMVQGLTVGGLVKSMRT